MALACNTPTDAIQDCLREEVCQTSSPVRREEYGAPVGKRLYGMSAAQCLGFESSPDGAVTPGDVCGEGSRFSVAEGKLVLTCTDRGELNQERVYQVLGADSDPVVLQPVGDAEPVLLYSSLEQCEQSALQELQRVEEARQRELELQRAREARRRAEEERQLRVQKARACCDCLAGARDPSGKCMPYDSAASCDEKILAGDLPATRGACAREACFFACPWFGARRESPVQYSN